MHSTTFLGGAAIILAGTSLAKDVVTKTRTVTDTTFVPLPTESVPSDAHTASIFNLWDLPAAVTPEVSLITSNPTATVYEVACPYQTVSGASEACGGLTAPVTITQCATTVQSASTYVWENMTETVSASCRINPNSTATATCVVNLHNKNSTQTATTATLTGTDALTWIPALVTGGPSSTPCPSGTAPYGSAPYGSGYYGFGSGSGTGTAPRATGTAPYATGTGATRPSGTGVAQPSGTGMTTSAGRSPVKPSVSPSQSPVPTGAASANAPAMVGALAGLLMAALAL